MSDALLIIAVLLLASGALLTRLGLRAGRRYGLLSRSFWVTFPHFARYRLRRLWPAPVGLAGFILLLFGAIALFELLLAYYGARLGHPFNPAQP